MAQQRLFKTGRADEWFHYLSLIGNSEAPDAKKVVGRPRTGFRQLKISSSVYNSIMNSGSINKITSDSLKYYLTSWGDQFKSHQQLEDMQNKSAREDLVPYEAGLRRSNIFAVRQLYTLFYDPINSDALVLDAIQDLKYQNLIALNYHYLKLQVENFHTLDQTINKIIDLIDDSYGQ